MNIRLRLGLVAASTCLVQGLCSAQWSTNPAVNLPIGDRTGEQNHAKIRVFSGGSYISWYDNFASGYDMQLQHLNGAGIEQWPHNGIRVADLSFSSTQDYDLRTDSGGNAVLCFRDDRSGSTRVTLQKIRPDGSFPWGPAGSTVAGSEDGNSPKCSVLNGDATAVVWTTSASPACWAMQVLESDGRPRWAAPIVVSEASRYMAVCDVQTAEDDRSQFIVLWVRGTVANPNNSAKHLYTQKFSASGSPLWTGTATPATNGGNPVIVFDTTSIQNGYFPGFVSDGSGGGVFGWYEVGGNRHAYIQRVLASGALRYPTPIASTGPTAGRIRISASVGFSVSAEETFLAWTDSSSPTQNMWGIRAQKFDAAGTRLWGESGAELLPLNSNQSSFVRVLPNSGGCTVFGFDARGATTGVVVGGRFDANGAPMWTGQPILACSRISGKARLDVAQAPGGASLLVWGDARSDANDVFAQRLNADGSLGGAACVADVDNGSGTGTPDGGVGIEDFLYYLTTYSAGTVAADIDDGSGTGTRDGGVGIEDLLYYIARFEAGC